VEEFGEEGAYSDIAYTLKPWIELLLSSKTKLAPSIRESYKSSASQVIKDFIPGAKFDQFSILISVQ